MEDFLIDDKHWIISIWRQADSIGKWIGGEKGSWPKKEFSIANTFHLTAAAREARRAESSNCTIVPTPNLMKPYVS